MATDGCLRQYRRSGSKRAPKPYSDPLNVALRLALETDKRTTLYLDGEFCRWIKSKDGPWTYRETANATHARQDIKFACHPRVGDAHPNPRRPGIQALMCVFGDFFADHDSEYAQTLLQEYQREMKR